MDRHRVAIVIPALNEAATIAQVVQAARLAGTCVVVDDGSTDATADLARAAGALVVSHEANRGYDAALESGFRRAAESGCEVIVTLDADGQHDPGLVARLLKEMDKGTALAIGVRDRRARFAEHLFACYTRWRWGLDDPLCGLKAYRTDVYLALGHFDSYRSIGTELLLFAARQGLPIAQVRFSVRERHGQPRFGRRLGANLKILRAMWLAMRPRGQPAC